MSPLEIAIDAALDRIFRSLGVTWDDAVALDADVESRCALLDLLNSTNALKGV